MKKVLISCATHDAKAYINALEKYDIRAIVSDKMENEQDYHGLLLPGGGDIAPIFYHSKNRGSQNICVAEDIIQLLLFHRFYEQKKPILGICKGMQLINVALGGTLYQTLQNETLHMLKDYDNYHKTTILPGSILYSLYGKNITTNSAHHQAIATLGKCLTATQYAFDGTIEGIEHHCLPILGLQWHPERMYLTPSEKDYASGTHVFEWFLAKL